jgi:hypothetical protein
MERRCRAVRDPRRCHRHVKPGRCHHFPAHAPEIGNVTDITTETPEHARILLAAVFGTQVVATLIAVYGLFMLPIGWGWALIVWCYSLVWFFVNARVKLSRIVF